MAYCEKHKETTYFGGCPYCRIKELEAEVKRLRYTLGEISMRVGQRKDNGDIMTVTAVVIELSDLKLKDQAAELEGD